MTAPAFRPAPYPRLAAPSAALATLLAAPRHTAAHRRQPPRGGRLRTGVAAAVRVLVWLTFLLGVVGWVALFVAVLA